jgi:phosphoribosyl-ATP pyrophosphohydrolase/phosphoribosyl-AMP cyclohydrolase
VGEIGPRDPVPALDAAAPTGELPSVRFGADGLAPAVVVDAASGRVLMLAYMDAEALAATVASGEVHFHSRSRGRLWRKGETSGNVLRLRSIALDCDADALLVRAEPAGPTCHRGTLSCFDPEPPGAAPTVAQAGSGGAAPAPTRTSEAGFGWLDVLATTIAERAATRPAGSYTARLLARGPEAVGRKVVEEAVEVLLAAKDDAAAATGEARAVAQGALATEAADLLYHLLVLLAERDLPPARVVEVLRQRHRP